MQGAWMGPKSEPTEIKKDEDKKAELGKKNYCKSNRGFSICTADIDWEKCTFAQKHSYALRCRNRRDLGIELDHIIHCSCPEAQAKARGR